MTNVTHETHETPPRSAAAIVTEALRLLGRDVDSWLMLFADNAVVEFPYAPSVDRPHRLEGKAAIGRYFRGALEIFRDLEFRGLRLHESVDAGAIIAEVHGSATISTTGRRYEQDYVMFFRVHGGKIVAYREYWNPIPALRAFEGAALPTLGAQA